MKFNSDMLAMWPKAFARAIRRAGFDPHLANDPPNNDPINARIVVAIMSSRFCRCRCNLA